MGNVRKCEVFLNHIRDLRAYKDFDDGDGDRELKEVHFFEPYKECKGV